MLEKLEVFVYPILFEVYELIHLLLLPRRQKNGPPALLGGLSERKEKEMFITIYEVPFPIVPENKEIIKNIFKII